MKGGRYPYSGLPFFWIIPGLVLGLVITACSSMFHSAYYTDYTIRKGDTLARIAERYGVTLQDVMEENDIDDPKAIEIGRKIRVPLRTSKTGKTEAKFILGASKKYVGNLDWPVTSTHLNSTFGWRDGRFHEGVDIRADYGDKIRAANTGTVLFSSDGLSGYGNLLAIKSDDSGLLTMYGHAQKLLVSRGQRVTRGDCIGEVGSTGRANGPHLHFEVRVRNTAGRYIAVDPLAFFR